MTIINKKEAFRALLSVPRKASLNIAAKNSIYKSVHFSLSRTYILA